MTKKKIIEDMQKRAEKFFCWTDGEYKYVCDGIRLYRDAEMPDVEFTKEQPRSIEYMFSDKKFVYNVDDAIYMDMEVLTKYLKSHRRPIIWRNDDAFIIEYKERQIGVNPWYLRDMLEYTKDNRLFFCKEKPERNPIYSVSEGFIVTQCLTLPVVLSESPNRKVDWRVA